MARPARLSAACCYPSAGRGTRGKGGEEDRSPASMPNRSSFLTRFARCVYRGASAVLRRLGPLLAVRGQPPVRVRRIVVARMWAVGELVMATPVLRTLREAYPDARIELLAGRSLAQLAAGLPWIDEVVVVDEAPLLGGSPRAWFDAIRRLRARRHDLGVCLHQSVLIGALLWLGGVRWRVGFDRGGEGFMHHVRVSCNVAGRHQVDEYLETVRRLGLTPSSSVPALYYDAAAAAHADAALAPLAASGKVTWIGLAPTGGDNVAASRLGTNVHLKRWPVASYVEVARLLMARADVAVVVLGGPAEILAGREIAHEVPGVFDLTGRLDLPTLAAVCARLSMVVANDSGPMHVAAASATRVLALFGPTDWRLTGPYAPTARVLTHPVSCAPCFRRDAVPPSFPACDHQRCMGDLRPTRVADAALAWLEEDWPGGMAGDP